jgi:capsular polysaccharide biosynthesis protein/Mrp family chromosome partitioning ATPase
MSTIEQGAARDLQGYFAILRRRLWVIGVVTLATVGVAAVFTFRQPTLYRSKMKIVVGVAGGLLPLEVGVGNVAEQFTQTMSELLTSDIVASRAIDSLKLRGEPVAISPPELLSRLAVTTKPDTAVLQVSYDDTDPARGVLVLAEVGDVFTTLVDQRLATRDAGQLAVSVSVFNPSHPTGQVQPKPVRNLAVASVLGLMLGLLTAVLIDQFDDTIRTLEDAETAFGQTATTTLAPNIVGFHPFDSQRRKSDPVLTELALQRLRASILWSPDAGEARTLLVTSSSPEEGKTTIAANLAVIMVTEGRNVIVVDGDLRHPNLFRYLAMPEPHAAPSIDAVLNGDALVTDALVEIPVPARAFAPMDGNRRSAAWSGAAQESAPGRLRAILASPREARPWEFGLARTIEVIEELRSMADFVIFDSPPILVVPDAYPFAVAVDTVVAVVRNRKTTGKATAALSRTLERLRARRVELVVTDAEQSYAQDYYYGHRPRVGASPQRQGRSAREPAARARDSFAVTPRPADPGSRTRSARRLDPWEDRS